MTYLPEEFLKRMQEMLGEEYEEFLGSYGQPRTYEYQKDDTGGI